MIQGALNGGRTRAEHPAIPLTADELAAEAAACAAAGASSIHLHARDESGAETIDPDIVNHVARVVKEACGLPVSVSSAPWIEPDQARRFEMLRGWSEPDLGSALFSDPGAPELFELFESRGIACEAAVLTVDDVEALAASGLAPRAPTVIVEPVTEDVDAALGECAAMHAALDEHGITLPRMQHGVGAACWPLALDALARGYTTRMGFEDVLVDPAGAPVTGNADLIAAALAAVA